MAEPSESWLDWHFQTQLRTYTEEDMSAACLSDRVIMARWLTVLKAAPGSQKMARNSLMLLMHGHLEDFGFLRAPFTDINNCNKDLNEVVNGYHGTSLLTPLKNARFKANEQENRGLQRGRISHRPKRIFSRSKLDPITEVTEPSSAFSIEENVNERETPITPLMPASTNVRQKIQTIEKELAMNRTTPTPNYSPLRNTHQRSPSIGGVNGLSQDPHSQSRKQLTTPMPVRSTQNIRKGTHHSHCNNTDTSFPKQCPHSQTLKTVCDCPSVVQKLKNCFDEVSERLKVIAKDDDSVLNRLRATAPPPRSSKKAAQICKFPSKEDISKTRLQGGESIPISYQQDKTMMDLLRQHEEMRRQCLQYYNLDGTLKDELPTPAYVPASTIEGFSIGASRAVERMKRWRGQPNQLRFFRTIFRGCGLGPDVSGRVKALDRRFELVALQWLRRKRRLNPGFGNLERMPPQTLIKVLEKQKAAKTEYMAHVAEIRKLCEIHCRGVVLPDVLDQMFRCLDIEYEAANEAAEKFEHQLQGMFSSTC